MRFVSPSHIRPRRTTSTRAGHPTRSVALLTILAVLGVGYVAWAGQPRPQATDVPTVRIEAAASAETIDQLTNAVELAQAELEKATARLAALKNQSASAGDVTALQTTSDEVQQELQQTERARDANRELLQALQPAQADPACIAAVPDALLDALPAVRQLKDAWTNAHANTAQLLVTLRPDHPRVQACQGEEAEISARLRNELEVAVRGAQARQSQLDAAADTAAKKSAEAQERLRQFATVETDCNTQAALVRRQTAELKRTQQRLSKAQTSPVVEQQAEVVESSHRSDRPQQLPLSRGPGRTLLVAAALVGSAFIALGLFMFKGFSTHTVVVPPPDTHPAIPMPAQTALPPAAPAPPAPPVTPARAARANCTGAQQLSANTAFRHGNICAANRNPHDAQASSCALRQRTGQP